MGDRFDDPVRDVREITVVAVVFVRGEGTPTDVVREVTAYFDPDSGDKLAEADPADRVKLPVIPQ